MHQLHSDVQVGTDCGKSKFDSVFQVILLLAGSCVTHYVDCLKVTSLLLPADDNVLVHLCLTLTIRKTSKLSLCKFHFQLLGALTVVPTLSTWLRRSPSVAVSARQKFQLTCDLTCQRAPTLFCIHQLGKVQCFHNGHGNNL